MKIIGEKINGTRRRIAEAITARDAASIQDLAVRQAEAGAAWLDVNAGTRPDREADDLVWLVETVQAVTATPLALDSANPTALRAALQVVNATPLINSISGQSDALAKILPLAAEYGCPVIALAMDDKKIPATSEQRLEVIRRVIAETRVHGIPDSSVYVDPLAMTISTNTQSAAITLDAMRRVQEEYPDAHLSLGLSNVSFGLPARSFVNRCFLSLAIQAGLDCAILDPLDRDIQAAIFSTELLLGRDPHCRSFIRASRTGVFDRPTA
jgi:cobalamin-dependent methionine synthase I